MEKQKEKKQKKKKKKKKQQQQQKKQQQKTTTTNKKKNKTKKKKKNNNMKMCDFHNTKMKKKKNFDFDFKCLKFHLKFVRKATATGSVPLSLINESVNESRESSSCSVYILGQITRCFANSFQDFPFSLPSICTFSSI